ncbi:MAG: glycosyl hydrolase family 32 [Arcanobacterium sp.]|nr:glycosyl hydrolase family 32 [Arcanobacterium sp.]MDY5588595.1 glycosyl hydrolase family 32 [Arcanobacterium sp.]
MALRLADHWLWDHWILTNEDSLDLFFLRASRALHKPHRRHKRASIGHARSSDNGNTWELLPDALVFSDSPDFDDQAIWTGSAVRLPSGGIRLFYTGISHHDNDRLVQRIGWADAVDGVTFVRRTSKLEWQDEAPGGDVERGKNLGAIGQAKDALAPALEADPRWYVTADNSTGDVAWRDPFVFEQDGIWHMLITAAVPAEGIGEVRGAIGHAVSRDLDTWEVQEPLVVSDTFAELECSQQRCIDGSHYLVFSCSPRMHSHGEQGYVWLACGETALGPFDLENAKFLANSNVYAAQIFQDTTGDWNVTGFLTGEDSNFSGEMPDFLKLSEAEFVL